MVFWPSRISKQIKDVPKDVTNAHCTFNPFLNVCNDCRAIHGVGTLNSFIANFSKTIRPLSCNGLAVEVIMPGGYVADTTQIMKFSNNMTLARMMAATTARSLIPR